MVLETKAGISEDMDEQETGQISLMRLPLEDRVVCRDSAALMIPKVVA